MNDSQHGPWLALAEALDRAGLWADLPADVAADERARVAGGGHPMASEVLDEVFVDGEEMAEGGVEEMLTEIAPRMAHFGVTLRAEPAGRSPEEGYLVAVNGRVRTVLSADDWIYEAPWGMATTRPLGWVNELLAGTSTPRRWHTLYTGGNEGIALLIDPAVPDAMRASGLFPAREIPEIAIAE